MKKFYMRWNTNLLRAAYHRYCTLATEIVSHSLVIVRHEIKDRCFELHETRDSMQDNWSTYEREFYAVYVSYSYVILHC